MSDINQCQCLTVEGTQCSRSVKAPMKYCYQHQDYDKPDLKPQEVQLQISVAELCKDLMNNTYKDELMNLARDLNLPVTDKTSKEELCKMLVKEAAKLKEPNKPRNNGSDDSICKQNIIKLPGSWNDYFQPINQKTQTGSFGNVMLVHKICGTKPEVEKFNELPCDTLFALKLFKNPLSAAELNRISCFIELSQSNGKRDPWPKTLVRYLDLYEFESPHEKKPYQGLLMNALEGVSLQTIIEEQRMPDIYQVTCWMQDILYALDFLHRNNIVHRDVHSGNIMITKNDNTAVLIDLDLMCMPKAKSAPSLCTGTAIAKSTAPDVWCHRDVKNALTHPDMLVKSDIWGTANAFLSSLAVNDSILTYNLNYAPKRADPCAPSKSALIENEVEYLTNQYVSDIKLASLLKAMLNADYRQRPSAAEAAKLLVECPKERKSFQMPPKKATTVDTSKYTFTYSD